MPALRQSQEDVLETLANSDLTIPPRELAELAVRHLHPELEAHLAGHPAQPFPCHIWRWHMPGGMLMHTLSGLPVLMNMAVLGADHLNCTEREMVENIYAWHNFCGRRVRIIHDSDECGLLSITPKGEDWGTKAPPLRLPWPLTALDRRLNLRAAMQIYCTVTRSTVRRDLFLVPIRFHQGITPAWSAAEAKIEEAFKSALAGYFDPLRPNEGRWPDQRTWSDIILDWGYARWRVRLSAIVSSISLHLRKMSANLAKSAVTGR